MANPNGFYTYAYLREDRTPYYIGKGKDDRAYNKNRKNIKPPKDKNKILILKNNLTEQEAFIHEIYMISVFGRKDLGTGILHNKTNGGDGASGLIHSLETKAKLSAAKKGENNHRYGKTLSPETKEKMSAAHKGKTHSPETKEKIGAAQKGENHHFYGKTHSLETKAKISAANKRENNPMYGRTGEDHYFYGKTHSLETKAKISAANKGENNYWYGKTLSPETKAKLSAANKGKMYITNGIQSLAISKNDIIPEGFRKGRTLTKLAQ